MCLPFIVLICLTRAWIIDRVEAIFEEQLDAITSKDRHLSVTVKTRNQVRAATSGNRNTTTSKFRTFHFPGKHEKEAWRYS
jgi:hypothetical protein